MNFWVLEERRTEDNIRTGWRRRGICIKDCSYGNSDKRRQGVNGWSPAGGGRRGGGLQEGQESSPRLQISSYANGLSIRRSFLLTAAWPRLLWRGQVG